MKKIVYIAHKISDSPATNLSKIRRIYRAISLESPEVVPFAPYYITLKCLVDHWPEERAIGMSHNRAFFERKAFDELWVFGEISTGVAQEIEWANEFGIPVVYKEELL